MTTKKILPRINVHMAREAARYYIKSGYWRGHRVHSPFVYHIVRHVITTRHRTDQQAQRNGREYRRKLINDKRMLSVTDLGTGSQRNQQRTVSQIASKAAINEKFGLMLYRLVAELKPQRILELGTSLGISTQYMAQALSNGAQLTSIEGSSECAQIASENLHAAGYEADLRVGNFDEMLPTVLAEPLLPTFFFIDGNHTRKATLRYFHLIANEVEKRNTEAVIIFDDIHLSEEMTSAWNSITLDERVMTSIDLFRVGIAFFRKGCQKEFYCVRW